AIVEFSHRIAATVVVVLIGLLVWRAVRGLRDHRWIVRGTIFAAVLVLGQAVLGGLTVENNLYDALVAAHLGLAMLLLATLIVLRQAARREAHETEPVANPGPVRGVAIVACVLVFGTIVAGGYVAGTEHEGRTSGPVGGAHLACGQEFPTCLGKFMPFGQNRLVDIQLTHRAFMYLA